MKICADGLRYKELEVGDVFIWADGSGFALMKTDESFIKLVSEHPGSYGAGSTYEDKHVKTAKVTRYPNVCISLGDPE